MKLPVRAELRDAAGVPLAVQIRYYDGAPFVGLAEGAADRGLMTRTLELRLLDARLPADYVGGRDFAALGFVRLGAGDTTGWYATTMAVQRDTRGNAVEQRDPMGRPMRITFDADGVYPVRTSDARGRETTLVFNPRAGEPARVTMPDGRAIRYEHDAIGRLTATIETDDAGVEQLVKCWVLDLSLHRRLRSPRSRPLIPVGIARSFSHQLILPRSRTCRWRGYFTTASVPNSSRLRRGRTDPAARDSS